MEPWDGRIEPTSLASVPGGQAVTDWFGGIPSFHDGYVLGTSLEARGMGVVRVHGWNTTDQVGSDGYLILEKHAVVTFTLGNVTKVNIVDFDLVGIVGCLSLSRIDGGFRLLWDCAYGAAGEILAKTASMTLEPGKLAA